MPRLGARISLLAMAPSDPAVRSKQTGSDQIPAISSAGNTQGSGQHVVIHSCFFG